MNAAAPAHGRSAKRGKPVYDGSGRRKGIRSPLVVDRP
ncbi:hypothetical protein SJ05684_b41790 (plasmid) [Sinorhizobium sojae CCBAU 05684]|uniref:Uncharacterized protein n=1 Tax=Sinorhizobium sojae CCBAU 05684 TaxID=716928 RepID=A0A249PGV7_9HYPH|nr:hypothetical protein SJ05684_b41790 [Sinorhizobium sojae CCBAU 05684]